MKRQRSRHAGCVTRHPGQSARSGPWAAPVLRNTSRSHLTCSRGLRSSHLDDHKVRSPSGSHSCVCVCVLTLTPITRRPRWHSSLPRATIALQGPGPSPAFYFGLDRSAEMVYAAEHSPESLRNELMRRAAGVSFSFRKQPSEEFFSRSFYILTKKHVNARVREGWPTRELSRCIKQVLSAWRCFAAADSAAPMYPIPLAATSGPSLFSEASHLSFRRSPRPCRQVPG